MATLYGLVDALGSIYQYAEFDGLPPQLAPAKGLRWLAVSDTRPGPGPGETLIGPAIAVTETAIQRVWTVAAAPVPRSVTPYQARAALARAGLLAAVETAVQAAGGEAQLAWEYAVTIGRGGVLVAQVGAALGLTEAAMDDLFRVAGTIEA